MTTPRIQQRDRLRATEPISLRHSKMQDTGLRKTILLCRQTLLHQFAIMKCNDGRAYPLAVDGWQRLRGFDCRECTKKVWRLGWTRRTITNLKGRLGL